MNKQAVQFVRWPWIVERGDAVFATFREAQECATEINSIRQRHGRQAVTASYLFAVGVMSETMHAMVAAHRRGATSAFSGQLVAARRRFGREFTETIDRFATAFPPTGAEPTVEGWEEFLAGATGGMANLALAFEELLLLWMLNQNRACAAVSEWASDEALKRESRYEEIVAMTRSSDGAPGKAGGVFELLMAPLLHSSDSIVQQLAYMRQHWATRLVSTPVWKRLLLAIDICTEEDVWLAKQGQPISTGAQVPGPIVVPPKVELSPTFSDDREWMPNVVMLAKSTLVWLTQLGRHYGRKIERLDQIPDEELDRLQEHGFSALWLIGVWERSRASREIKQLNGAEHAAASAYSIYDYEIAESLGGKSAYENLKNRAKKRGIRLATDMVPNHTAIDSKWMADHPDRFLQTAISPYPNYSFTGPDLSQHDDYKLFIEDGYWDCTDAAVVFKRVDTKSESVRYVYHGNDGTGLPWNDTAQLDYSHADVREAVIQSILLVASMSSVIRFDAAMTLASSQIQRLWFPVPGGGGGIPSRAHFALSEREFAKRVPREFWREVVERVAKEYPDTLLLAEAFWMMEGYFVRELGMHRVYNSAFMNMLKAGNNAEYRNLMKVMLAAEPEILKRFVNFMNNPDEESAAVQFGRDDKYFGVCLMMATMPGVPMFGHGQIEGYSEKYGMEFTAPLRDERPDEEFQRRHEREIIPLLKKRSLFSDVKRFNLYDFVQDDGSVDEDVFVYSNSLGNERALVVFCNSYKETNGVVREAAPHAGGAKLSVAEALSIPANDTIVRFKDALTDLYYLRSARDVAANGWRFQLRAFEHRCFLDFHLEVDSPQKPWRALERALGGRGVLSLDDAMASIQGEVVGNSRDSAIA